jgi:hypothetical protein
MCPHFQKCQSTHTHAAATTASVQQIDRSVVDSASIYCRDEYNTHLDLLVFTGSDALEMNAHVLAGPVRGQSLAMRLTHGLELAVLEFDHRISLAKHAVHFGQALGAQHPELHIASFGKTDRYVAD